MKYLDTNRATKKCLRNYIDIATLKHILINKIHEKERFLLYLFNKAHLGFNP